MPFNKFLRKYMFPVPKPKTTRNILEILFVIESTLVPWRVILPFYPLDIWPLRPE